MTTNRTIIGFSVALTFASACAMEEGTETEPLTYDEFVEQFVDVSVDDEGNEYLTIDDDLAVESWDQVEELWHASIEAADEGEVTSELLVATVGSIFGRIDVWSPNQRRNLTYCVSNNFAGDKAEVVYALNAATADWEGAANLNFIHLPQHDANCTNKNNAVVFNVRRVTGASFYGRAFFPSNPRSQRELLLNFDSISRAGGIKWGPFPLRGILRHELGHALGLRHETTRIEIAALVGSHCLEDFLFRRVTPPDLRSVMMTPACVGQDGIQNKTLPLSNWDRAGIRALYP